MKTSSIYVFSGENGSMTTFLKKGTWSCELPKNGTVFVLGQENNQRMTAIKGEVIDARETQSSVEIRLQTQTSLQVLRDCLVEAGWEEIPLHSQ